ncbi:cytochrome c [Rhizobium grahamii]|uniref:Cytochrome C n=1 Tax=Rhizobium grahamii TaxID=1120045 RepID=A0A370KF95_9HYPH|nr:cytochrome C [Rhizobium grahamii]
MKPQMFMVSLVFLAAAVQGICAEDIVTLRQADMKAIASATKAIAGMFKEPSTYSSAEFKWAAELIRDKAGQPLIDYFSAGAASPDSKAKPGIVEERKRFDRLAIGLGSYAGALAAAADRKPTAMTDGMRMKAGEPMGGGPLGTHVQSEIKLASIPAEHTFHLMLQTCTTCHVRFRME